MEPWASPFSAGIGVRQPLGGSLQLKWFHESRRGEHSSSCTPMGRAKGPPQRIPAIHPTWSWRTAASSSHLHVQTHQTEEKTITKVPLLPWDPPPVWQLHAAVPTHTSNLPTWFPLGVSGPDAVDTSHKPPPISSRYDTHRRSAPWTWGHVERTPLFGAPEFSRDKMRTRLSYLFFFVERHGYWKTKRITRARIVGGKAAEARAAPEEDQISVGFFRKNVIYGNVRRAENVYVKMFTNSPSLVCMDLSLSQEEIIDPKYSWTGPDGRNLEGRGYANLTGSGELMLVGFQESMSGAYTCTLSHRIIETSAQEEVDVRDTYRFMVYAYREANHVYQVSVRFTAKGCELAANARFVEELKKIMESLISDLTCGVKGPSYRCHSLEAPHRGSPSELFITFQVNPFAPGWEDLCSRLPQDCEDTTNRRAQEATERIGEFFRKQTYALKHQFQTVPTIHYVEGSFSVTPIDSCRPGFGRNNITHRSCAGCCVVCSPGTYSPDSAGSCRVCAGRRTAGYGAKSCP
ncbi:zona pellucida-binding protein 2 isoform X1 [Gallus gallus]|uniref:zona pellucida-binding protein 2 isoform X1 n=1 Tax=Gallus gallus TaxID=9031 RepID=UPI001F01B06D|nr:zona pellucida-binding protein 2 isoform X1 [Gallus gallus]